MFILQSAFRISHPRCLKSWAWEWRTMWWRPKAPKATKCTVWWDWLRNRMLYVLVVAGLISTYRMLSTLRGLMKTAMGWRPAIWRRFIAFPDTSSMQCLPWRRDIELFLCPLSFVFCLPSRHALSLNSPCRPLLWQTVYWFHTDGCYIVRPRWTCAPGSPAPWALWRTWSGNLCRPPRSLAAAALCLRIIDLTQIKFFFSIFIVLLILHVLFCVCRGVFICIKAHLSTGVKC